MTKSSMPLSELLEKHDDGDFLRAVAEAVLQLLMETDVEGVVGAGRHERSDGRTTDRNGYRDRALDTRVATLNLRVPKLRQGLTSPTFWSRAEPRRRPRSRPPLSLGAMARPCLAPGRPDRRGLEPARGRAGAGDGAERYAEEHRVQVVQRDLVAGAEFEPAAFRL